MKWSKKYELFGAIIIVITSAASALTAATVPWVELYLVVVIITLWGTNEELRAMNENRKS